MEVSPGPRGMDFGLHAAPALGDLSHPVPRILLPAPRSSSGGRPGPPGLALGQEDCGCWGVGRVPGGPWDRPHRCCPCRVTGILNFSREGVLWVSWATGVPLSLHPSLRPRCEPSVPGPGEAADVGSRPAGSRQWACHPRVGRLAYGWHRPVTCSLCSVRFEQRGAAHALNIEDSCVAPGYSL